MGRCLQTNPTDVPMSGLGAFNGLAYSLSCQPILPVVHGTYFERRFCSASRSRAECLVSSFSEHGAPRAESSHETKKETGTRNWEGLLNWNMYCLLGGDY